MKSEDPRLPLTVRLPSSVLAKLGTNPRAALEALVLARYGAGSPPKAAAPVRAKPAASVSGLQVGPRRAVAGSRLKKR